MTCIVGMVDSGRVYIGADSATVSNWLLRETKLRKVFRYGDFIIGGCGTFRMLQVLEHHLAVEDHPSGWTDMSYMVRCFIPAVRKCMSEHGFAKIENNQEEGGSFLVGYHGHLFSVGSDFQIGENAARFDAVGRGDELALGAMYALQHTVESITPEAKITICLEAAAHFDMSVGPPFHIETLEGA